MVIILNKQLLSSSHLSKQFAGAGREIRGVAFPVLSTMEAYYAQRISAFRLSTSASLNGPVVDSSEIESEDRVNQFILNQFLSQSLSSSSPQSSRRVCFIHSVLIPAHGTAFLTELLDSIWDHGLAEELSGLWVLNYGLDITTHDDYPMLRRRYPTATFIHRSNDRSMFEIPTLRHVQYFANAVSEANSNEDPERDVHVCMDVCTVCKYVMFV